MISMKLEEYVKTLPGEIISGEQVQIPDDSLRDIFDILKLNDNDVFYHLGCGDGSSIKMALQCKVKKAVGVDWDKNKIGRINEPNATLVCCDVRDADISDATAILFWFVDQDIIDDMMSKFEVLQRGCRIATIWSPLPECLPTRVEFPYIINEVPFARAGLKEQLLSVFGVSCIDFVTAWEYSERYTKAINSGGQNDRFLTILQAVTLWINAKNLGVACDDEMPESIQTYISILRNFFGIEVEHLLK